jgi:hypothetical protein
MVNTWSIHKFIKSLSGILVALFQTLESHATFHSRHLLSQMKLAAN